MTIYAATSRGVNALVERQGQDGFWRDFNLPVGTSDEWVTAYVALALAEWAEGRSAAERALRGLILGRTRSAGFGFNSTVDADTDSTACVVLLSAALEQRPDPADITFLQDHARPDGGYATFHGPLGWGNSHACVTPVVALALLNVSVDLPSALVEYATGKRASDGTWNSYWWSGPFYATAAWLRLLEAAPWLCCAGPVQNTDLPIRSAMDLAFAVEIAARWKLDARDELCQALLEHQEKSGLWAPSRCLRVTDESCLSEHGGWGEVFVDQDGLMTTATALRALSAFRTFAPQLTCH